MLMFFQFDCVLQMEIEDTVWMQRPCMQKEEMSLGTRLGKQGARHILYNSISCLRHANNQIGALKFESGSIPSDKNITQKVAMRLLWQYTLTDCTVHDSVCKSSFLWKWSRVQHSWKCYTTSLDTIQTIWDICLVFCFAACLSANVLHDLLRAKFRV